MNGEESMERVVDESAACMKREVVSARSEPTRTEKAPMGKKPENTTNNDQAKLAAEVKGESSADADAGSASGRASAMQACSPDGAKLEQISADSVPKRSPEPDQKSSQSVAPISASQLGQTEPVEGGKSAQQTRNAEAAQKITAPILNGCKTAKSDENDLASRIGESAAPDGRSGCWA